MLGGCSGVVCASLACASQLALAGAVAWDVVLPAMGVISELVAAFSRNRVFGYKLVAFASLAIGRRINV